MKLKRVFWLEIMIILLVSLGLFSCDNRSTSKDELDDMTGSLGVEALSDSQVRLTWNSNADVKDKYLLERAINEEAYGLVAELATSVTAYIDTALTAGVIYRYRISGITGEEQTNYLENSIELTFLGISSFTGQPQGIHTVHLEWNHECEYESGYLLERMLGEGMEYEEYQVLAADVLSYTDTLAIPGMAISYRLRAFTAHNESAARQTIHLLNFPSIEDLAVHQLNVNIFNLTWTDMSEGEDGFSVERRIDAGPREVVALLGENSCEYLDNIEQREQIDSITWWVTARYLEYSSNTETVTEEVIFPAPHIELIEQVTLSSCRLIWEDRSEGETGFSIDRQIHNGPWEIGIGQTEANVTEWIDEGVTLQTSYFYRLHAFSSNNESDNSNLYFYEQQFPQPTGLVYTIETFGIIDLTWEDNSIGEEGFRLDRRISGEEWEVPYQEFPANTTSFSDTNLTSGQIVSYRIYAFLDDLVTYPDMLYNISVIVPAPDGLYYLVEDIHTISLHWSDFINGEEGYRIDRRRSGIWTEGYGETAANAESWVDIDVPVNELLIYRVYAFAGEFNGNSAETILIDTAIPAPTSLTWEMEGISTINLYWVEEINGENGFYIDRYIYGSGWENEYGATAANAQTWTDADVPYGSTLRYRVYAYYGEAAGNSAVTGDIIVSLPAPENLHWQRPSLTSLLLEWNDVMTGEEAYVIDKQTNSGVWETEYAILAANSTSFLDTDLDLETEVCYRVYIRLDGNDGAAAETELINLDFPAPQNFSVSFSEPNQLYFTWDYGISGIDGFILESYSYNSGWTTFADGISAEVENWMAAGNNWGLFRLVAYLGAIYTATSETAGVAPEGFVAVAGGYFEMGDSYLEGDDDELPVHEVNIYGFYVSSTEITQESYIDIMGSNPSTIVGNNLPVETLDWWEAVNYCNSRSLAEGFNPCYTISGENITCDWYANGYRLLTEAEWEYAARGGVHWQDNYRYSGSNNIIEISWNNTTTPYACGTKQPNQLGIYDMSGNVWEMCWDLYDNLYYNSSPLHDPCGPEEGFSRSTRGGGFNADNSSCRVANRYHRDESYSNGNIGFRICRRK